MVEGIEKPFCPGPSCQLGTASLGHDEGVMEGEADGHVPVISHDSEKRDLSPHQGHQEIKLQSTAKEGNAVIPSQEVVQHLEDSS